MNDIVSKILIFTAGAAVGAIVSWKICKNKCTRIMEEEMDSVSESVDSCEIDKSDEEYELDEEDFREKEKKLDTERLNNLYEDILRKNNYISKEEEESDMNVEYKPVIISPDEFADNPDYSVESLTLYLDGAVEDQRGYILDDDEIEEYIGKDSLNHFGEYEDDSVFVRNDKMMTYYEILKDDGKEYYGASDND